MEEVRKPLADAIEGALKKLLSEKHLYQYVGVGRTTHSLKAEII
jgi:hypothetical protein